MPAPKEIVQLVERFQNNRDAYKSGHYNETQVRREFVDPFFKALGWDIDNEQGFAEAYKDVIHEDAIKVGGTTRAPDYSFRIGGQRKFFLETKKPSVDIKEDIYPAFQLRRYAWTAKLPLSILTDFEEFSVYDCTIKPDKRDKPSKGRILYLTYEDYLEQWDEIEAIFSKNAILKGSFDRYAQDKRGKRGTAQVDSAFLEEIAGWREVLARNIALRNPELDTKDLNYVVQATVNRIIFLRICEDRGIEKLMKMEDLLSGERVYPRLCELFRRADERYNSSIFHFEKEEGRENPDTLSLRLNIDDKPLKDIIRRLYYPDSPYEFSVLPAEILGQVYEQLLGKVIRLTDGHRAVVEDKPEVKKAGGVKYTPSYIVDYIVKNTLGPALEDKTPSDASKISVLDPACGSGSFLIVAYQHLLDWHREWYGQKLVPLLQSGFRPSSVQIRHMLPGNEGASKGRKKEKGPELPIFQGRGGEWRLTTAEKKRILLNNIYGVDIDRQAVEVTKLSLLLKVLEGENEETISKQLTLFSERALPDLSRNIKCGNSLIGWDILEDNPNLGQKEIERINPFDWRAEYPEVSSRGGFDVVIGNPPYIRIQMMKEWAPDEVEYFKLHYTSASRGNYDIYVIFAEKGLSLLNEQGHLGFILPHKFFNAKYGQPLRKLIYDGKHLAEIVHFGDQQVFEGVTTYTCLLFLDKSGTDTFRFIKPIDLDGLQLIDRTEEAYISADKATSAEWNFSLEKESAIFDKLATVTVRLEDIAVRISQGIRTSANEVYVLDLVSITNNVICAKSKILNEVVKIESDSALWFLQGREIRRYAIQSSGKLVVMPYTIISKKAMIIPEIELSKRFPRTYEYLCRNKDYLNAREKGRFKGANWYVYGRNQNIDLMLLPKILVPDIANHVSFVLDQNGNYAFTSGYGIILKADLPESEKYILGLLNSKLSDYYLKRMSTQMRGGFYKYETRFIRSLPIRTIDFSDPADAARHDHMVSLVERMLALHKQLQEARTPPEKTALQRQIEATDRQIDALVYELYGLTEEEIRIVEGVQSQAR